MTYAGGKQEEGVNESLPEESANAPTGMLALNVEKYRAMLGDEIPDEESRRFLEALWEIMTAFVHLGWGVDSVQRILAVRMQNSSDAVGVEVELNGVHAEEFEKAALHVADEDVE